VRKVYENMKKKLPLFDKVFAYFDEVFGPKENKIKNIDKLCAYL
jgi:hypothetical protein